MWELEDIQQPQCKAQLQYDSLWSPKTDQHFSEFPHGWLIQGLKGANPTMKKNGYCSYTAQLRQM